MAPPTGSSIPLIATVPSQVRETCNSAPAAGSSPSSWPVAASARRHQYSTILTAWANRTRETWSTRNRSSRAKHAARCGWLARPSRSTWSSASEPSAMAAAQVGMDRSWRARRISTAALASEVDVSLDRRAAALREPSPAHRRHASQQLSSSAAAAPRPRSLLLQPDDQRVQLVVSQRAGIHATEPVHCPPQSLQLFEPLQTVRHLGILYEHLFARKSDQSSQRDRRRLASSMSVAATGPSSLTMSRWPPRRSTTGQPSEAALLASPS